MRKNYLKILGTIWVVEIDMKVDSFINKIISFDYFMGMKEK